ncbi:MAG: tRNA threonylcarbamoyladenosine dehydratase [Clostridia bacterium]
MQNQFSRTQLMFGKDGMEKLYNSHVAVFGIGGVGGYVVEALVRSGIGKIDIIDDDKICLTNLNRQIFATSKTIGKDKVDASEERIHEINPNCEVTKFKCFYTPETSSQFDFSKYNYIVDAIDTVTGKIEIVRNAKKCNIPVISCMGAGNKVDPTAFIVSDIYKTSICPLAKVMRKLCKENNIDSLKVVYSKENAMTPVQENCKSDCDCTEITEKNCKIRKQIPSSNAFVPSVAGLILAGEVIKDITGVKGNGINLS